MLRTSTRLAPIGFASLLPWKWDHLDKVKTEKPTTVYGEPMREVTGMDRLRAMFTIDEFGGISDSLNSVLQCTFMSTLVGGIYGGTIKGRMAYTNFMENNQATMYQTNMEAKKKLQDALAVAFGKGAFQMSWRLACFTAIFTLASNMLVAYTGKASVWHYTSGGALAGAAYKASLGPRGMIVGGTVGGLLGTLCGSVTVLLLEVSGVSIEDIHFWQHQWRIQRKEAQRNAYGKLNDNSKDPLLDSHEIKLNMNPEIKEEL